MGNRPGLEAELRMHLKDSLTSEFCFIELSELILEVKQLFLLHSPRIHIVVKLLPPVILEEDFSVITQSKN